MWSRKANAKGVEGWTRYKVFLKNYIVQRIHSQYARTITLMIELRTILSVDDRFKSAIAVAFAKIVHVIFVYSEIGH
jgi:hypothetical protein